jgi:hypothetical protein
MLHFILYKYGVLGVSKYVIRDSLQQETSMNKSKQLNFQKHIILSIWCEQFEDIKSLMISRNTNKDR